MADQQQSLKQDPPIYKHLSPKTQAILRATATQREEAARLNDDTMSNEQT
jgi:nucleoside-diphosphate kinase